MNIKLVQSRDDLDRTFDVMSQLRPQYDRAHYVSYVYETLIPAGLNVAYLEEDGAIRCVSGFRISASLAWGKYIYVDDIVSEDKGRSRGYGKHMLDWIARHGKEQGCGEMHLDSGVQRHAAHRFYLRERMDIVFYHFKRVLG